MATHPMGPHSLNLISMVTIMNPEVFKAVIVDVKLLTFSIKVVKINIVNPVI